MKIPAFRSMSYQQLDEYFGVDLGRGDRPTPHGIVYVPHHFRPQVMEETKP